MVEKLEPNIESNILMIFIRARGLGCIINNIFNKITIIFHLHYNLIFDVQPFLIYSILLRSLMCFEFSNNL